MHARPARRRALWAGWTLAVACGCAAAPTAGRGAPAAHMRVISPGVPVAAGEELVYRVTLGRLALGTVTMSVSEPAVEDSAPAGALILRMRAKTGRLASTFYALDDTATSLVERETLGTIRYRIVRAEKGGTQTDTLEVDRTAKTWRFRSEGGDGPKTERTGRLDVTAHDAVAVFYALRLRLVEAGSDPAPGTKLALLELGRRGTRRVELAVVCREELALPGVGVFRAVKLAAPEDAPGFLASGEGSLWLDEATGILLRMEVKVSAGTLAMTLAEARRSALAGTR